LTCGCLNSIATGSTGAQWIIHELSGADMEQIQKMLAGYICPHCGKSGLMKFTTIGGDFVADGPNEETGEMIRHVCQSSE